MRKLIKWLHGNKGFTLIELLVVVAILGTLAAVVTPNVISFMRAGDLAAANGEAAAVQTAVDGYTAQNGVLPADDEILVTENYFRGEKVGEYEIIKDGASAGMLTGTSYGDTDFKWGTPVPNQWNKSE